MKPFTVLFALSLAACSSNAASSFIPTKGAPQSVAPNVAPATHNRVLSQKYVYVTDAGDANHPPQVLAYPMGVSNPAPVASVALTNPPKGIAVDSKGRVYVALWNVNTVEIFKPGLTGLAANSYHEQIASPEGVAIDEQDNVYVANHCTSSCSAGYVAEFPSGTYANPVTIHAPLGMAVHGIAARSGYLYMDVSSSAGGAVDQYRNSGQPTGWQFTGWQIDLGSAVGVALDNGDNVFVANVALLQEYTPPGHQFVNELKNGACEVRYVGRGSDGSIYAPIMGSGWSSVVVWPAPAGSQPPYSITTGLVSPMGAAAD